MAIMLYIHHKNYKAEKENPRRSTNTTAFESETDDNNTSASLIDNNDQNDGLVNSNDAVMFVQEDSIRKTLKEQGVNNDTLQMQASTRDREKQKK